jgi:hypothetical protein
VSFSFSLSGSWGTVLGIDMIVVIFGIPALAALVVVTMRRPAERLARDVNLALTPEIGKRLDRFLRLRNSLRAILLVLLSQLVLATTVGDPGSHRSQALVMLLLPGGIWISVVAVSLWPRWKSRGPVRMAHLRRLHLRDTVTTLEIAAIAGAYAMGAALAGWALWHAGTQWRQWFWLPAALLAGQAVISIAICGRVMNAPAAGGDSLELAWDDVLRFDRVRSLLETSSFATLAWIAINAADVAKIQARSLPAHLLLGAVIGLLASGYVILRDRSPARDNWRKSWPS